MKTSNEICGEIAKELGTSFVNLGQHSGFTDSGVIVIKEKLVDLVAAIKEEVIIELKKQS